MRNGVFAILSVAVILCASLSCAFVTEEREEPDGFPPLVIAVIVAGSAGAGVAGGWFLHEYFDSDQSDTQPYLRLAAANNITDVMSVASVFTANSNSNYAQLWGMTKEHWIRQAELEAYTEWQSGKAYDGNSILTGARAYENNATMTANAVAQIDSFFGEVSEKVASWRCKDTYNGMMEVGFVLDNTQLLTDSNDVQADLISVADATGSTGKVYIGTVGQEYIVTSEDYVPGYVYNFGARTSITSSDGLTFVLENGKNYLSSLRSTVGNKAFVPGIYTVSNSVIGGDTLSAVMGSSALSLKAGLSMSSQGETSVAYLESDRIVFGNNTFGTISFKVVPNDIPSGEEAPDKVDLTPVLKAYQTLLDKLYWTSVSANSSASAVWNIYDRADEKDYGVTTLMASNVYDSVVLSEGMNEILTISAMQQLATYYDANGDLTDLQIGLYSDGMDAPFVRGSILDEYGNRVYDDVIFTPFFQSEDTVLERGVDYEVQQNTLIAVWTDGKDLTAWYNDAMRSDGYDTLFVEKGYTFQITQLGVCDDTGMHSEPKVDFKVTKVSYISPGKADLSNDPDADSQGKNILKIVCIAAGVILAVLGLVRRNPFPVILGIGLIVFGVFFSGTVWEWIARMVRP